MEENVLKRFRLEGKKAFVTGASGLIGYHTAKAFAQAGADVAIVDIPQKLEKSQQIADEFKKEYGVNTLAYGVDVTDEQGVTEMCEYIAKEFGTIDVVHNNAGIGGSPIPDLDVDYSWWKHVQEANLGGIFLVARAAARIMVRDGHGGSIVNTASMCASIVNAAPLGVTFDNSAYSVSKAGVKHFTRHFATQMIPYGIRVNCISPGYVLSDMHSDMPKEVTDFFAQSSPCQRTGQVEEMQGAVLYLASDASTFCVGTELIVDGGHVCY
ncbi:MAG: SDR family oxidoreductase [Lachnospiraceae bacterium]|nr:SDR family oxidoreductase [Lachnospiraceae bacterium]